MAARRAAGDAPRADRMGGTAPSFMATRASVRCSTPMWLSCRAFASRRECSRLFLARGVNGRCPAGYAPGLALWPAAARDRRRRAIGLFGQAGRFPRQASGARSEEHTSELQSRPHLVCRLLLEKKKKK